ncbi:MAG: hypothetical protein WBZ40_08615 [Acidimicrobiia bacterium]
MPLDILLFEVTTAVFTYGWITWFLLRRWPKIAAIAAVVVVGAVFYLDYALGAWWLPVYLFTAGLPVLAFVGWLILTKAVITGAFWEFDGTPRIRVGRFALGISIFLIGILLIWFAFSSGLMGMAWDLVRPWNLFN